MINSLAVIVNVVGIAGMAAVLLTAIGTGRPLRNMIRSGSLGLMALIGVHIAAAWTRISLGFGWLTGVTALIFGIPGITALMLIDIIL